MQRVNFICAGAQKSGTTTLFGMLNQHPDVYLPPQKELYYFDNDRNYKKGSSWYESLFQDSARTNILGDITPDYMLFPECAGRIFEYNPDVKLLFMLRNPADRAFSHYIMNRRTTEERKSFEAALEAEASRIEGYKKTIRYSYMARGYYYELLKPYYALFPKENIKIVVFEEFIKDIPGGMKEIEEFLGIRPFDGYDLPARTNEGYLPKKRWIAYVKRHFVRPVRHIYNKVVPESLRSRIRDASDEGKLPKEKINPKTRASLIENYNSDITDLGKLISRDLSIWS